MPGLTRRARDGEQGQGMTEYIIVVALVALAAIGVVTIFGDQIRELLWGSNGGPMAAQRRDKAGTDVARVPPAASKKVKSADEVGKASAR